MEREQGAFVDAGVCRCSEPADWSLDTCHHFQKRRSAATGKQKEGFISQHVSIFLQNSVCVSLKGEWWWAGVSATDFSCLFSAAYFRLCLFSGLYGRQIVLNRQEPSSSNICYLLNELVACETNFQQNHWFYSQICNYKGWKKFADELFSRDRESIIFNFDNR